MIRWLILPALALFANAPASTPEWSQINRDTEREQVIYVDKTSIALLPGNHARGTWVVVLLNDMQGMAAIKSTVELDCPAHKRRWVAAWGYDDAGKLVWTYEGERVWKDILPGSFYAVSEELICSGGTADIGRRIPGGDVPIALGRKYLRDAED